MKIIPILMLVALIVGGCGQSNPAPLGSVPSSKAAAGSVTVEILYLNHPPVRKILQDVDTVLASYGTKVNVTRYDLDTQDGQALAQHHGLTGHFPIAIAINGTTEFDADGRKVQFVSFPQGQGTGIVADGSWTIDDLRTALDAITKGKE